MAKLQEYEADTPLQESGTVARCFSPFSGGDVGRTIVPCFAVFSNKPLCTLTPKEYLATEDPPSLLASAADPRSFALVPLGMAAMMIDASQSASGLMPAYMPQEAIPWNSELTIR